MSFAVVAKIIILSGWPILLVVFFYFKDKEKFKRKMKKIFERDD